MYLTYEKYKFYGGNLDETAFMKYCFEAEKRIEFETHSRASATEAVERCVLRLIELLNAYDPAENQRVSSFSHDGLSKSFASVSKDECDAKATEIICTYLMHECDSDGTPLLYRGVNCHA